MNKNKIVKAKFFILVIALAIVMFFVLINRTSNSSQKIIKNKLRSIIFDGKQFLAVGDGNILMTSPDGVKWNTRKIEKDNENEVNYHNIAYGGGYYIATGAAEGAGSYGVISYSKDAIKWKTVTEFQDASGFKFLFNRMVHKPIWNGKYFIVGTPLISYKAPIEISTSLFVFDFSSGDLIMRPIENQPFLINTTNRSTINALAFTGNEFAAFLGSVNPHFATTKSTENYNDISSWKTTKPFPLNGESIGRAIDFEYTGSHYVVSAGSANGVAAVISSIDGVNWKKVVDNGVNYNDILVEGNNVYAIGDDGSFNISVDGGATFKQLQLTKKFNNVTGYSLQSAAIGKGVMIIIGQNIEDGCVLTLPADSKTIIKNFSDSNETLYTEEILPPFGSEGQIKVKINGQYLLLEQQPVKRNNKIMVPLKSIFETLGALVTWNDATKTFTVVKGTTNISIASYNSSEQSNAEIADFERSAIIINGEAMMSIDFICEELGASIAWNEQAKTVEISAQNIALSPGKWSVYPTQLVCGEKTRLEIRYENGSKSLPPGASHTVRVELISISEIDHAPPSEEFKIIPYKGKPPVVKMSPPVLSGVGYQDITLTFPKGLKPYESFAILHGNKESNGEIIALANTTMVDNLAFEVFSILKPDAEEVDWARTPGWWTSLPRLDIKANKPEYLRVFLPMLSMPNEEQRLRIAVVDAYDNSAYPAYNGTVSLSCTGLENLPESVTFSLKDNNSIVISGIKASATGIYRIRAINDGSQKVFESNPMVVKENIVDRIYFGSLHNHGNYSECWGNDIEHFFSFPRDISGLDFFGTGNHMGPQMPANTGGAGRLNLARIGLMISPLQAYTNTFNTYKKYNDPEKGFVCIMGYEAQVKCSTHYNMYDPTPSLDRLDRLFPEKRPVDTYNLGQMVYDTNVMVIPHSHAGAISIGTIPIGLRSDGTQITSVIEGYSDWGMGVHPHGLKAPIIGGLRGTTGVSYREILDKGYLVGFIADSDTHTGLAGRRTAGGVATQHNCPPGITGAYTDDYTETGIINAYSQRKTYGTSGERIYLNVQANGVGMGSIFRTDSSFSLEVEVAGTDIIESIIVYDRLITIEEKKLGNSKDAKVTFNLPAPEKGDRNAYMVEVIQKGIHRAWSSPIWVENYTATDLKWVMEGEELYLVNEGNDEIKNINVEYGEKVHRAAAEDISTTHIPKAETTFRPYLEKFDDNKTMLHIAWDGMKLNGTVKIIGSKDYTPMGTLTFARYGKLTDNKAMGTFAFTTNKVPVGSDMGIDTIVQVSHTEPTWAIIELEQDVTVDMNGEKKMANRIEIPLNGLCYGGTSDLEKYGIESLAPGTRWKAPGKKGYYYADPLDEIFETNESNNLYYKK